MLFLTGNKILVCWQCGSPLRLNRWRLVPFALVVNTVAAVLGLAIVRSKLWLDYVIILAVWIGVALTVYPFVVSLVASNDKTS